MTDYADANQSWMFRIGLDTNNAQYNLKTFGNYIIKRCRSVKNRNVQIGLLHEGELLIELVLAFQNPKLTRGSSPRNCLTNVLWFMGEQCRRKIWNRYLDKLNVQTQNYLNATQIEGPIKLASDAIYTFVGDIKQLMYRTDLITSAEAKRYKYDAEPDWYQTTYRAMDGPWYGKPITGYWYFQEYGFYHHISGEFIRNKIFYDSDINEVLELGENKLDYELNRMFKDWANAF